MTVAPASDGSALTHLVTFGVVVVASRYQLASPETQVTARFDRWHGAAAAYEEVLTTRPCDAALSAGSSSSRR